MFTETIFGTMIDDHTKTHQLKLLEIPSMQPVLQSTKPLMVAIIQSYYLYL